MKKLLLILLALVLVVTFAACTQENKDQKGDNTPEQGTETPPEQGTETPDDGDVEPEGPRSDDDEEGWSFVV